jgi:serine/threonine protein kinase
MENWIRRKTKQEIAEQEKTVHLYQDLKEEQLADGLEALRNIRKEHITPEVLETRLHEKVNETIERLVINSNLVGQGYDGLVFKVDSELLSSRDKHLFVEEGIHIDETENAIKILKVYNPLSGEREYQIQKNAYDILANQEESAKVPKPNFIRDQKISNETRKYLNNKGAHLADNMESILMDYIDGKDLSTLFFEFVLQKNGYEGDYIDAMSESQKYSMVANILGFTLVDSNVRNESVAELNEAKLIAFLKNSTFNLDSRILSRVEKALEILAQNKIYHNDLHGRNVRVGSDGEVYILDFGRSSNEKSSPGNYTFLNIWKKLLPTLERRGVKEETDLENLGKKIIATEKGQAQFNEVKAYTADEILKRIKMVSSDPLQLDILLVLLKKVVEENPQKNKIVNELIQRAASEIKSAYAVNKLDRLLSAGYF